MTDPDENQASSPSQEDVAELVRGYLGSPTGDVPTRERSDATENPEGRRSRPPNGTICSSNNQYIIREEIGRGGMGTVFRAFDTKLQRDVALKILDSADDDYLSRFLREQEITACLDHPNFVRILATGYIARGDGTVPFYTMPLVRGQNLERLILRLGHPGAEGDRLRRDYPQEMLLHLFGQLCLTIQSAHDTRIIHRDLKPSNILIGPYGDAYVTDLGLAKFLGVPSNQTSRFERHVIDQIVKLQRLSSATTGNLGTPYYMAPEQLLAPWTVDHRADVFGLGGILYFILTGQRPKFVPPPTDHISLEERRRSLERQLDELGIVPTEVSFFLKKPKSDLSRDILTLMQEYEDVLGMEKNSEYHRFRMTMRNCEILPPREVLSRRESDLAQNEVPLIPRPKVSPELEAICMKALAKVPKDRFPSSQALWHALIPHWAGRLQSAAAEPEAETNFKLWI